MLSVPMLADLESEIKFDRSHFSKNRKLFNGLDDQRYAMDKSTVRLGLTVFRKY